MMRQLKTNCPNCGGILESGKCPYCGTKVQAANELDIICDTMGMHNIELTLNIRQGDIIYQIPLEGRIDNINISNDICSATDSLGHTIKTFVTQQCVDFIFSGRLVKY